MECLIGLGLQLLGTNSTVILGQEITMILVGRADEYSFSPQVGGQVGVGLGNGSISSLGEVTKGSSASTSSSVAIFNTSHLKKFLGYWSRHNSSTTGSRDQTDQTGATFTSHLAGDSVRSSNLVTPVSTADWDNGKFGQDDGTTDGSGNFLGAFDSETNVSIVVANGNKSLEAGTLTSSGLFLDRHDLEHFIFQGRSQEEINDFKFFDGEREKVNLFK